MEDLKVKSTMNEKGNPDMAIAGTPGGSSAPGQPGAGGSSAPANVSSPVPSTNDMSWKMAVLGGGGGDPTKPSDIPAGYEAPKIPGGDMQSTGPGKTNMAYSGTPGGSSKQN